MQQALYLHPHPVFTGPVVAIVPFDNEEEVQIRANFSNMLLDAN